jgi:hypothetical protein
VREERGFAKFTWQVSSNHQVAFSVNHDPQEHLNQGLTSFTRQEAGFTLNHGGFLANLRGTSILSPTVALETSVARFESEPSLTPNLHPDINGNGTLYYDRNNNGFLEPSERDPGEDWDQDGAFDVYEDTTKNGKLDEFGYMGGNEDRDGDLRLTPPGGCEGQFREDFNCSGGINAGEDRNRNGIIDDTPFPTSLYPYGVLRPEPPDRDYTIDQFTAIVSGPFYQDFEDLRARSSLRQDLSVFVIDAHGSHDFKMGYLLERESFDRTAEARPINGLKLPPYRRGRNLEKFLNPGLTFHCNPYEEECPDPTDGRIITLLPIELKAGQEASGRSTGFYVQDTYKPRPNLSVGVGLRFDRETIDTSGYTTFDPQDQRAQFDRLFALSGGEFRQSGTDLSFGDANGIKSKGILGDPIATNDSTGATDESFAELEDALLRAAAGRLTRHRSEIEFTLGPLASLFPDIFDGGEVNPARLAELGIVVQQPQGISLTNDNLSPRLSISWDPWADGRTKFFGTWGRYYDKLFLGSVVAEQGIERIQRYYVYDRDGFDILEYSPTTGNPIRVEPNHYIGQLLSKSPPSSTQVSRGLQTPFSDELVIGFERELAPEVSLSLRYIDRRFRDQLQDIDLNHSLRASPDGELLDTFGVLVEGPGEPSDAEPPLVSAPDGRPDLFIWNPFFNEVLRIGNFNEARYKAIELGMVKRQSRRWELQGSYTYSRAIGAAEDFQSRLGNDPSTIESEFGYLDFDQRHVVKLNISTYLPGDWQLAASSTWSSGLPYSVVSRFFALDNVGYQQFRTRYGFTTVEDGESVFRQLSRNSERNHAVYDFNLRAKKSFVLGKTSAALFLEVFNVLNSDDLRIYTYSPTQGVRTGAGGAELVSAPLQLDAERRFGRRYQVGIQFDF